MSGRVQPAILKQSDARPRAEIPSMTSTELAREASKLRRQLASESSEQRVINVAALSLERGASTAPRSPYMSVLVSGALIGDHSDLSHPQMLDFVQTLIFAKSLKSSELDAL